MQWLLRKKFSRVDLFVFSCFVFGVVKGDYFLAAVLLLSGIIVSALLDELFLEED